MVLKTFNDWGLFDNVGYVLTPTKFDLSQKCFSWIREDVLLAGVSLRTK